jgi:hypothetical protein
MPNRTSPKTSFVGFGGPVLGSRALAVTATVALSVFTTACGEDERTRILDPVQVAMDESVMPSYSNDDMTLFEVKKAVPFPIIAPNDEALAALQEQQVEPYGRHPWVTLEDHRVQLSWTLTNLDDEQHEVQILVDPWNEFGRYYPGLTLVDAENGEVLPNLSGIDNRYILEATSKGAGSRRQGVYTYEDLDELARDFGTVMSLIDNPPTAYPGGGMLEEGESALPAYVNHAFDVQNRSERDPLIRAWIPGVVAGLTGIDVGLRTEDGECMDDGMGGRTCRAPRMALEVVVEITDLGSGKVRREGASDALLPPTQEIVTIGTE